MGRPGCMSKKMAIIKLDFTRQDKDRHGNVRWYYVRKGVGKVRLNPKGVEIGSPRFFELYDLAHAGKLRKLPSKADYTPGTLAHLIDQYLKSPTFNELRDSTQTVKRRLLLAIHNEHGHLSAAMTPAAVRAGRDARRATPAAANNRMRAISALYNWGIDNGLVDSNPTLGIKKLKEGPGLSTWTREQIEQYRAYWPLGTHERLALELFYGTAQRRGDVALMGPQHIAGGSIRIVQGKTGRRLTLPIIDTLAEALRVTPAKKPMSFIGYRNGNSLGTQFRRWCDAAGLPKTCSAHGLRKARATHLAEAGKTAHQISAVTGHKTLSEVQRYTLAADQERLAQEAFAEQSIPPTIPRKQSGTLSKDKSE